jgi:hypothetical protein
MLGQHGGHAAASNADLACALAFRDTQYEAQFALRECACGASLRPSAAIALVYFRILWLSTPGSVHQQPVAPGQPRCQAEVAP